MGDVIEPGLRTDADGDGEGTDEGAEEGKGLGGDRSRAAPRSVKAEQDQSKKEDGRYHRFGNHRLPVFMAFEDEPGMGERGNGIKTGFDQEEDRDG